MKPNRAEAGLSVREYVGYSLGDAASNLFYQTFNIFLTYYYVDVWGIAGPAVATMLLVVRLLDAVADPMIGMLADRTQTRWGKFRPFLLWAAIPYGICGYLIFANPDLGPDGKQVYMYATYLAMMLAYSAINVPYSALLGVLSPSSATRTVASSYRFVGAYAGGVLITLGVRPLVRALGESNEVAGFQQTMGLFAALSIGLFWLCFAWTRERVTPPPAQKASVRRELAELFSNRPWVVLLLAALFSTSFIVMRSSSTLFYFKYYLEDSGAPMLLGQFDRATVFLTSGMLAQVAGTFGLSFIARRADKRVLSTVLTIITGVCYGLFFVLPKEGFVLGLVVNAVAAFCLGPTSALVWAMYADVADYGEWKFGRRTTGLVYSASLFALKAGMAVGGALVPLVLARFGFSAGAAQTEHSRLGLLISFSLMPALFAGLKAAALWSFPIDQSLIKRMEIELAERRRGAQASRTEAATAEGESTVPAQ